MSFSLERFRYSGGNGKRTAALDGRGGGSGAACAENTRPAAGSSQKRKQESISNTDLQRSKELQPSKRRKKKTSSVADESDKDHKDPRWDEQENMVGRLQIAFPNLDKEELREVLREHQWCVNVAIEVLYAFSDIDGPCRSPAKKSIELKSPGEKKGIVAADGPCRTPAQKSRELKSPREKKGAKASGGGKHSQGTGTLSRWLITPASRPTLTAQKPCSAADGKPHAQAAPRANSSDSDDGGAIGSEFEGSSHDEDESDQESNVDVALKAQILSFFQEASVDELSLITSCSAKKAQRIVELRPFSSWQALKEVFREESILSLDLLWGCKVVLRERQVVLRLMSKCESISRKMTKDVTSVIKSSTNSLKQPRTLNSSLRLKPYQLIGLKWLVLLHKNSLSGILADEMGLGKTIQAISFLAYLYQEGNTGPHLITAPSSTLDNWVQELKLWCPSLKVLVYHGSVEDRRYLRHDILNEQMDFNVIVSTYNVTIGNESDRSLFRKLKLQCAVFDEGHMLKNMNSQRYRHLMAINAQYRLLLTGTPLQNNLFELVSLLNFIMPSMFSSSTSRISKMFSMKSEEQSRFEKDRITQAKLIMKPFILRRVKSEVLKQLPAKEVRVESCPMSKRQHRLYMALLENYNRSSHSEKKELCNVMMQLRKMANHPLLHRQYYTSDKLETMSHLMLKERTHCNADPVLIQEDMEVMSDFELHRLCQQYPTLHDYQLQEDVLLDSGKFALLTELLASFKQKGDRVVLFSQFTMMLDIVEVFLRHLGHRFVRLDGSTPRADRIVLINQYNNDPEVFVFLLSTRAGGLGINLTSANVVILHDIDCNPYNDKQAEDRCHRLGQTRTVQVIKLISRDSIEDCMLLLGQKKLKLEQDMTATEDGEEGDMSEDMASLLKASLGL
ncbi:SWI/SNF-related matrix-associated actin-dependent regulator of chromatin subfamily A containing DEAD/H box 1A [Scleropages formosus]|uniref:SWI/SNF-related matrix-associated actin-dependent regulator of chromatin subfamily A containing DEAD/H box 1A n=1 Tax=Scleropages formosus TaxID=113540 RepID=UPI000878961D|nr:SWI/SNF-related matrix-associated actin-dependent regulator of chromatin subfamily A containing DEAD/H box 1 [Scleropages formosus]